MSDEDKHPEEESKGAVEEEEEGSAEFHILAMYSRAQAIADGVLIDVSKRAREAGIKYPVAMTAAVWDKYVKLTPAAERACNDEQGRLWDILWMFSRAALRAHPNESELYFQLRVVTTSIRAQRVTLKAVCGPGDDENPVITIMLPNED